MSCSTRSLNTKAFVAQGESFDREDDSNVQSYLIFAGLNNKIGKDGVKCNASFKKVISTLNFSLSTTVHSFILYTIIANSNSVVCKFKSQYS